MRTYFQKCNYKRKSQFLRPSLSRQSISERLLVVFHCVALSKSSVDRWCIVILLKILGPKKRCPPGLWIWSQMELGHLLLLVPSLAHSCLSLQQQWWLHDYLCFSPPNPPSFNWEVAIILKAFTFFILLNVLGFIVNF